MAELIIEDLHAGYNGAKVLKGVDIEVDDQQIACLIGPNGAGKSTVFRCIYNLLTPTKGSITYQGKDIVGRSQRGLLELGISLVLQRDAVFEEMTVKENLELGAYIADRDYDTDEVLRDLYKLFPILGKRSDVKAGQLSGGQRQMVELARGLMLDPDFLLLDEPTAGLAPKIIDDVFSKIIEINERGVTILMIEQNVKTGLKYADHGFVLEGGQTVFEGEANTLLDQPEIRQAYLGY